MNQSMQNYVRPAITLYLAVIFGILILGASFGWCPNWKEVLGIFMAIFGPIIGFWFGERSALKIPGKEGEPTNESKPVVESPVVSPVVPDVADAGIVRYSPTIKPTKSVPDTT